MTRPYGDATLLDPIEGEVFDMMADGASNRDIAAKYGLHRNSVRNWLNAGGEARQKRYQAALEEKADWHTEEAERLLDAARWDRKLTPSQASIVRDQAKRHLWMAEKLNRRLYGEQPAAQINVGFSVGALHLDALRQHGNAQLPVVDAKLIASGTDEPQN